MSLAVVSIKEVAIIGNHINHAQLSCAPVTLSGVAAMMSE